MSFGDEPLYDASAERVVLAGIYQMGHSAFIDTSDVLDADSFYDESNQLFYQCFKEYYKEGSGKLDEPTILSVAKSLGLDSILNNPDEKKYLRALKNTHVEQENIRKLAKKVKRLDIARRLRFEQYGIIENINKLTGDEPASKILAVAEEPVLNFAAKLGSVDNEPKSFGLGISDYIQFLKDNPNKLAGLSTGFNRFDNLIGDGLERGTISVIAARPKQGKAQPINSIVYTPSGPRLMGNLKVGDLVCNPYGSYSEIIAVHPQGVKPVFQVTFEDGDSTYCCEDHLWSVSIRKNYNHRVVDLKYLMEHPEKRWRVKLPLYCKYDAHQTNETHRDFGLQIFTKTEIPSNHLYNTLLHRNRLIQAATEANDGSPNFEFSFYQMALDWKELMQSVGSLCSIYKKTQKDGQLKYLCISREVPYRYIKTIKPFGQYECQCITLKKEGNLRPLYLTDNHIVTHNSMLVNQVGLNITTRPIESRIPVLNADTELHRILHWNRLLANISGIPTKKIKKGTAALNSKELVALEMAAKVLEAIPYHYQPIASQTIEENIAMFRRWILKNVGLQSDGTANPCLIVYDWLKLPSGSGLKDVKEYQALGFALTELMNFARKYMVPILAFAQLNRDGIGSDDTDAIAQSDRIVWFCSNLSYLKKKNPDEMANETGPNTCYTHQLITVATREGELLDAGDYINLKSEYHIARISEGPTRNELRKIGNFQTKNIDKQVNF